MGTGGMGHMGNREHMGQYGVQGVWAYSEYRCMGNSALWGNLQGVWAIGSHGVMGYRGYGVQDTWAIGNN